MDINLEASASAPRDSATVVMLRDGAQGLEVFLLKRHGLSDVLGGAYVFPGGKVDAHDAEIDPGAPAAELSGRLAEDGLPPGTACALFVAAMREAFEETGVLFSRGASAALAAEAWASLREGRAFDEVLAAMGIALDGGALHPWSRWITPAVGGVIRKRFDTRFFLAQVPPGQEPRHDDHEATESVWLTPRAALEQYRDRAIELAPPQIMSLAHLSRHQRVDSALRESSSRRPPLIHPEPFEDGGERVICYPGDPRHSVRVRALPGPTRLHYRERRFEPAGGFEALFEDS